MLRSTAAHTRFRDVQDLAARPLEPPCPGGLSTKPGGAFQSIADPSALPDASARPSFRLKPLLDFDLTGLRLAHRQRQTIEGIAAVSRDGAGGGGRLARG